MSTKKNNLREKFLERKNNAILKEKTFSLHWQEKNNALTLRNNFFIRKEKTKFREEENKLFIMLVPFPERKIC